MSASVLGQPAARADFQSLDANADGFLTRYEAAALPRLEENFHIADRNDNGLVDPQEFQIALGELRRSALEAGEASASAGGSSAPSDLFRRLDRDGDGHLSENELWSERGQRGNWIAVDRNADGRVSPSEFTPVR